MVVKIVTDSTSDIPPETARSLGIAIVPAYVRFGDKVYRDRVDITADEFFQKLVESNIPPATSAPSPGDFAETYHKLLQESDNILSIHVTSKLSAICNAALQGKEALGEQGRHIEVIDSQSLSMGLGLITIAVARAAQEGKSLEEVANTAHQAIPQTHVMGLLDTFKYVLRGGRLGKAAGLLGAMLNVKPLLTMREGELSPIGFARNRPKGVERLVEFVKSTLHIDELAIVYSTTPREAETLADKMKCLVQRAPLHISRLGPALGAHGGPGVLLVALRKGKSKTEQVTEGEKAKTKKTLSLPFLRAVHYQISPAGLATKLRSSIERAKLEPEY